MVLKWEHDPEHHCYVSMNNIYCSKPLREDLQSLHIFVPEKLMSTTGQIDPNAFIQSRNGQSYTAQTIPIIFYNDIGGYAECSPAMLMEGNERFLRDGYVLVSVGARGRQTRDDSGNWIGKAPAGLVDLKAALRWLRKHQEEFPGNTDNIISVGTSAGGAMSSLLGVSADEAIFAAYLESIGAEMDVSDAVFAAQCYCPITNLEHADMAYEWMFGTKKIYTMSSRVLPHVLTAVEQKISQRLAASFPKYINQLELGVSLGWDGRSGSFYDGMLASLSEALNRFLERQAKTNDEKRSLLRELDPTGSWLSFGNDRANITDLDAYVQHYIGRMKPCPAFDKPAKDSPENEVFGNSSQSRRHFTPMSTQQLNEFSAGKEGQVQTELEDPDLQRIVSMMNPMNYITQENQNHLASHFRIRLGSKDADTSFAISYLLYLALKKQGIDVDYALIWGLGHCDADYNEEFSQWVDKIVNKNRE